MRDILAVDEDAAGRRFVEAIEKARNGGFAGARGANDCYGVAAWYAQIEIAQDGAFGIIGEGDVQWMTAGAGILHKEYHEQEFSKKGGPFEMVQLWVNLPKKDKGVEPHYQAITADQMGKITLPDNAGTVEVIAGSYNETLGPAETYTPVNLANIKLNDGGEATASTPASHNTALLVINGKVSVNGEAVNEHNFVLFKNEGEEIQIKSEGESVVLLLSGEPINEPIVSYGPFVMNTEAEIRDAILDFQAGKFGTLD